MFENLPGFREFYPDRCAVRNHVFAIWKKVARRFGFSEYDVPILEPLELYKVKSGPEIVSQLFAFTDQGGREVALRPELTPSLARIVGARAASLRRPVKWFTVGENFRYEKPQKGRLRSHYQLNADILGEAGAGADAELLALLVESLFAFGLTDRDFRVRLSDRKLWILYLEAAGVRGEDALGVLRVIDKAERRGLESTRENLIRYFGDTTDEFLKSYTLLAQIRGIEALRDFFNSEPGDREQSAALSTRLDEWESLIAKLDALGVGGCVQIDLGIVRGLAYYTGFVYEVFDSGGASRAIAAGGRYDDLVGRLGYGDLPAAGFAMGDVVLTDLLEEKKLVPTYIAAPDVYLVVNGEDAGHAALADAHILRESGLAIEYALKPTGFGRQFKQAGQSGARLAAIYGSDELLAGKVKIRDLMSGAERAVDRMRLLEEIDRAISEGIPES